MILYTMCNSCLQPYELLLQESDLHLVKQLVEDGTMHCSCPRLCGGKIFLGSDETVKQMSTDPRLKDAMKITGKQLYQAVNGMGLPDESPTNLESVVAMLIAHPIKSVGAEEVGGKVYLHELHLSNGVTVHLSSGHKGAQVLKLTKGKPNAS